MEAGRVIAGTARGIRLASPGEGTRPLADRAKQTVFAILEPDLDGCLFLDLCAGSGAGGIEALSRGAAAAVLVERDEGAARVIAENLGRTGLAARASVVRRDDPRGTSTPSIPSGPPTSSSSTRRTRRPRSATRPSSGSAGPPRPAACRSSGRAAGSR